MLYKIAHWLRSNCEWIWETAEVVNSVVFGLRYRSKLGSLDELLKSYPNVRLAIPEDAARLAVFFAQQPEEDFKFFRPHAFDERTLRKLIDRTSFMMFVVESSEPDSLKTPEPQIVGYFFLRSFVHGQCYLGKMVDHEHQGQGIGKMMCKAAMYVATYLRLRMFESINKENMASMRSTGAVLKQVVVKELEDGDVLIEDLPMGGVGGS